MFKDDRMISILSGIVLMLAIGTLVQRQDLVADFFGDGSGDATTLALRPDEVSVAPDTLTRIDVLANDTGFAEGDEDKLAVLTQPGCGRVFVQGGALQFLAENDCEATQKITYTIEDRDDLEPGVVVVSVIGATGTRNAPEPARGGGIVLASPTLEAPSADQETTALGVERNTAPARPLPSIVISGGAEQPRAPTTETTTVAAAPRPSAPGSNRPAAPSRAGSPSAPQIGGLRAPQIGGGLDSGLALADSAPTIGGSAAPSAPSLPGRSAPSSGGTARPASPGALAGLTAPSAPSSVGRPAGSVPTISAPSRPGSRPAQGTAPGGPALALAQPGAPRQPGTVRPTRPTTGNSGNTPSAGASPSVPSPSVPAPSTPTPAVPSTTAGGIAVPSAPSIGGSAPSSPTLAGIAAQQPSRPGQSSSLGGSVTAPSGPALASSGAGLSAPSLPGSGAVAIGRSGGSPAPSSIGGQGVAPAPSAIGRQATPTLALARVEVPNAIAAPNQAGAETMELAGPDTDTSQLNPGLSVGSVATGGEAIAFAEPTEALREIMDLRDTMSTLPLIDTTGPEALAQPGEVGADRDVRVTAISPDSITAPIPGVGGVDQARPDLSDAPEGIDVARLPSSELACVVPPSITLDVRAAGETDLMITSPCHADTVAELAYLDMRFGVQIDRTGRGEITMYGFETSADAALSFKDDETLEFSVPFTAVERTERVALAWDAPIVLGLHALEFSNERESSSHVRVDQPRDFRAVRRRGGGYLVSFAPIDGVGQNVQIYTHWIRRGGKSGVVKMYMDFPSRHRDRLATTCGTGEFARPSFTVTRSSRGRMEEPEDRRLGALSCDDVTDERDPLIGAAVRDIIISQR
ncbi:MAG: hypothetical protein AAFP67_00645 [Pseudomonadota bacterium]